MRQEADTLDNLKSFHGYSKHTSFLKSSTSWRSQLTTIHIDYDAYNALNTKGPWIFSPNHPVLLFSLSTTYKDHYLSVSWMYLIPFPTSGRASLIAQTVKHPSAIQDTQLLSKGREDPLEKEMETHSSILTWRIPWTEKPGGLQSTGSQRARHDWATDSQ